MMRIHELNADLAAKIAAGEVIERPVSVVKELMENSLDAGATVLEIELVQGGKVLISVKDNGCGIAPDDLPLAALRHATSKISSEEDLEKILTLGYRGEALYSMAAVSQLEIYSRCPELAEGAVLSFTGGQPNVSSVPLRPGTTVTVRDLFFNLPARRKFLKSATGEFRRISRIVQDYALAYPAVAFSLMHDGKKVFKSDGLGSTERLLEQLWGTEPTILCRKSADFPQADSQSNALSATVWWQDGGAQSRFQLVSFVNGRRINDAMIRCVFQTFPWAGRGNWLVMMSMPPEDLDVNVHPSKLEVLFHHSSEVFDVLRRTIGQFAHEYSEIPLLRHRHIEPVKPLKPLSPSENAGDSAQKTANETLHPLVQKAETHVEHTMQNSIPNAKPSRRYALSSHETHPFSRLTSPNFSAHSMQTKCTSNEATEQLRVAQCDERKCSDRESSCFLGQFADGYLLFRDAESLIVMDPHAAHERINFERIVKASAVTDGQEQLIAPLPLPPSLQREALEQKEELRTIGFCLSDDGALAGLPVHANALGLNPVDLLRSALKAISEHETTPQNIKERWAMRACKASVKLTTALEPQEAVRLLTDLEHCDEPNACPHGRPTVLRLNSSSLDKYFGRQGL